MLINAMRALMAEFGIVAPVGVPQVMKLLGIIADTDCPVAVGCGFLIHECESYKILPLIAR
jgi:hypothetical protein